jgi:hypothetical protein
MSRTPTPVRRFRPAVERLEERDVPANVTQFQQIGNLLRITGTPRRDNLRFFDDGFGNITVVCPPDRTPQLFTGVNNITLFTLGGDDNVRYALPGTGLFSRMRFTAVLGDGDDTFAGAFNGCELFQNMIMDVRGGVGDDLLTVNALRGVDLNSGTLSVSLFGLAPGAQTGGAGDRDTIVCNYAGRITENLTFIMDGGPNDSRDVVVCNARLRRGSFGRLLARVRGGNGNDVLRLTVLGGGQNTGSDVDVDALIDGGGGIDAVVRTGNVAVRNVP